MYEEKENYKGYTILVYQDEEPYDPREDSNIGKFYLNHRDYTLPKEIEVKGEWDNLNELIQCIKKEYKDSIIYLLKMYDHSGVSISWSRDNSFEYPYNCSWDSSWIGVYVLTQEAIKKEGISEEKAREIVENELDEYCAYFNGDMCGYTIKDEYENYIEGCSGFYNWQECLDEAKYQVDQIIEDKKKSGIQKYEVITHTDCYTSNIVEATSPEEAKEKAMEGITLQEKDIDFRNQEVEEVKLLNIK